MGRTERFEEPHVDAVIEAERQPNHGEAGLSRYDQVPVINRYSFVVRDTLEVTPVVQQGFDSMGTYIDGSW